MVLELMRPELELRAGIGAARASSAGATARCGHDDWSKTAAKPQCTPSASGAAATTPPSPS